MNEGEVKREVVARSIPEEKEVAIAIKGDEWASTKTADRGGYYFAGLSEGYYNGYLEATRELQCECRSCVYTDSPCVLSDYGKDNNGICDHFKNVFDENAELKETIRLMNEQEARDIRTRFPC